MSQVTLDIIRGIAQASANAYDGALDDKGEPIKVGLKREEGHPVYDSRQMDGFKCRIQGNNLILSYQSDIKLKDVYAKDFENDCNQTCADIMKWLKKEYKKVTGNNLSCTPHDDIDILVQSTSKVRVFVTISKMYKIGGLDSVDDRLKPSEDRVEGRFKKFLEMGGWSPKAQNSN
jgi:hypothetical protein